MLLCFSKKAMFIKGLSGLLFVMENNLADEMGNAGRKKNIFKGRGSFDVFPFIGSFFRCFFSHPSAFVSFSNASGF